MGLTTLVGKMFGAGNSDVAVGPGPGNRTTRSAQRMQYCATLDCRTELPARSVLAKAWKQLEQEMAVVPAGPTLLVENTVNGNHLDESEAVPGQRVEVDSFYIDRTAVTNAEFAEFVKAGGYENMELWSQDIWSHVLQLVDQSGNPGPRYWQNGRPAREKMDHPVVGICWYEAEAYASWVGKRLPDTAQWQRAACWHTTKNEDVNPPKFPWGDTFETKYANAWISGIGTTVPVESYYDGATPNGTYQLIGNTWEFLSNRFVLQNPNGEQEPAKQSDMIEIRGGAFDTYMDTQMTCQFRTGQPLLFRGNNVGFRCVSPVNELHRPDA